MKQKLQGLLADFLDCRGVHGVYKRKKVFRPEKQTVEDVPVTYFEYCREELTREADLHNQTELKRSVVRAKLKFVSDYDVIEMAEGMVERRRSEIARNLKLLLMNYCKAIKEDVDSEDWKKESVDTYLQGSFNVVDPEVVFQWSVWICTMLKIVNFESIGVYDFIETKSGEGIGSQKLSAAELNKPKDEVKQDDD